MLKNIIKSSKKENHKSKEINENIVPLKNTARQEFNGRIVIKQDKEKQRLLKLQQEFSAGKIEEEDISEEDTEKLCKLYDEQIAEIKKSTEMHKKKIIEIRRKLNQQN